MKRLLPKNLETKLIGLIVLVLMLGCGVLTGLTLKRSAASLRQQGAQNAKQLAAVIALAIQTRLSTDGAQAQQDRGKFASTEEGAKQRIDNHLFDAHSLLPLMQDLKMFPKLAHIQLFNQYSIEVFPEQRMDAAAQPL